MSEAEHMNVSPAQMNSQTKKIASPKETTLEQTHEFGSESVHNEPSEQKHHMSSEKVQNEPAEISTAVSNCMVIEQLGPHPDDVTKNSLFEHMGPPPEDATNNSHFKGSPPEDAIEKSRNGELGSRSGDVTKNSNNEELSLPPEDATKNSSTEQLGPPPECVTQNSGIEQSGMPPKDAAKNSSVDQFELQYKDENKNTSRLGYRDKRNSAKLSNRKNKLKSLAGSDRVLRSRSQEKPKTPEPSNNMVNVSAGEGKKRRKKKRVKKILADEYSKIRKHLRYFLNRIGYERSLIDAYSGEGWKGQSLEKLKPEKELQRATSEIFRRKLKIRDLFQRLDSLCAEGRFPESLFDSDGQICSEDIFCAKCGLKELSADNDIILCDGACDRGFHQFCLEPPLLKEEIPPGDEGWLCPGCDCKVDCIDLLNESQGTRLSISDSWEKVFPEEAATAAGGNMPDENFGFPSDDSEDNDYDPEGPEVDGKVQEDESSSDESDFTSASEDLEVPPNDDHLSGLPSDDSEDDDYDPNAPDLEEQVKQESSSSDFTSDSEDFGAAFDENRFSDKDEGPVSSSLDNINPLRGSDGQRSRLGGKKKQSLNDELLSISESDPGLVDSTPVSGKRHVERLDYKKLYDETYGNGSSDSSDDEDWTDTVATTKRKNGKAAPLSPSGNSPIAKNGKNIKDAAHNLKVSEHTPKRRTRQKLNSGVANSSPAKSYQSSSEPGSSGRKATSSTYRRLGEAITQRLYQSFKENQYPDRATKENMAEELGITINQVSKWFENARWSSRHSTSMEARAAKGASKMDIPSPQKNELDPKSEIKARDAACNGVGNKESPKAGEAVKECCSGDVREERKVANEESSGQKSTTLKSRKREKKFSEEISKPPADLPIAHEGQTRSRIQTRNRKSVS
ncbi:hypothetical protein L1049_014604 [Liquidambar formosana]|uniref:Uncharacterized protein n=1 Tax=Liquidambar formosana TaxID=63359 RepID=A0AAP0S311_LIQFO